MLLASGVYMQNDTSGIFAGYFWGARAGARVRVKLEAEKQNNNVT
jgi:hypothetical protein